MTMSYVIYSQAHLDEECELRPAECPYASLGCHVESE